MPTLLLLSLLGITKVVVIAPASVGEPLVTGVVRELQVAGYTVDREAKGDLALSAEAHDAVAAMALADSSGLVTVDVWAALGDQTKTRHKEMEVRDAGDRRGAALRAVEILRGVLLELGVQLPTPITGFVNPYAPVTSQKRDVVAAIDTAPADTAPRELVLQRFTWLIAAGAGALDLGKPQGVASIMVARRFAAVLADVELSGAFTTIDGAHAAATATVRPWTARLALGPLWSFRALDVAPFAAVGLDLLEVRGSAPQPFVTHAPLRALPQATLGLRLIHRFAGGAWLGVRGEAGWIMPARLTIADSHVLDVGPLAIVGELLVGWVLD